MCFNLNFAKDPNIYGLDNNISGKYHWDSKDNDYYIYVQTDDNQNLKYRYRENDNGGTLCLLENNKCIETYLPSNS